MDKQLIGQASKEQIDGWKNEITKKFGENHSLYAYEADGRICYLRSVDRETYAAASAKVATAGPNKFTEVILENIWMGGDETLRKVDGYYYGLQEFVEELMAKKKGSLTKI